MIMPKKLLQTNNLKPAIKLLSIANVLAVMSCGINVDVGKNGDLDKHNDSTNRNTNTSPDNSDRTVISGSPSNQGGQKTIPNPGDSLINPQAGSSSSGNQSGYDPLMDSSCFGQFPVKLQDFCSTLTADHKSHFAEEYQLLCTEQKLTFYFDNNSRHSCYWYEGGGQPKDFLNILHNAEGTDKQDFKYASFYAIKFRGKIAQFRDILLLSIVDSEKYNQVYAMPAKTYISNPRLAGDEIFYSILSDGALKVSYDSKLEIKNFSHDLIVLLDRDFDKLTNIKQRKNIKFLFQRTPEEMIFVSTERLHLNNTFLIRQFAPATMVNGDLSFMDLLMKNAKIAVNQ